MAVEYAKEREQFGRPIGAYQAVSHRLAEMLWHVEEARSLLYYAAWCADAEPESLPIAASMAKARASDAANSVTHNAIQTLRRHRLHLGARRPLLPQARPGQLPADGHGRRAPPARSRVRRPVAGPAEGSVGDDLDVCGELGLALRACTRCRRARRGRSCRTRPISRTAQRIPFSFASLRIGRLKTMWPRQTS